MRSYLLVALLVTVVPAHFIASCGSTTDGFDGGSGEDAGVDTGTGGDDGSVGPDADVGFVKDSGADSGMGGDDGSVGPDADVGNVKDSGIDGGMGGDDGSVSPDADTGIVKDAGTDSGTGGDDGSVGPDADAGGGGDSGIDGGITPMPGDPLTGSGVVSRTQNTYTQLFGTTQPSALVAESNFAVPDNAAPATQNFEGTLTLTPTTAGYFSVYYDPSNLTNYGTTPSPYNSLPPFSFQFVQNGSYLVPAAPGYAFTGSTTWNLIVGTGRVWRETTDGGYMRASVPVTLVEYNENCTHNGVMTFLFNAGATPNISKVRYQFTGETCSYFMFDMAGQVSASYTPAAVPNGVAIANGEAAEMTNRIPVKPITAVATDYPASGIDVSTILAAYTYPQDVQTYGIVYNSVNYNAGCTTRHSSSGLGNYAFCNQMRMSSFSTAKSAFTGVSSMRLGQLYGNTVYTSLIKNYVPEYTYGGNWSAVTISHALDMATGNYISSDFESDEDSNTMLNFFLAVPYATKIAYAISPFPYKSPPGTLWVYQSSATFIAAQALNAILKQKQGSGADLFNMVVSDVYVPLKMTKGFLSNVRTDNSPTGAPTGFFGLFWSIDDIAKMGQFLAAGDGKINGTQVLDQARLQDSLFRTANTGLPVTGSPSYTNLFYNHTFWGKKATSADFPGITCEPILPFMSGVGGVTIMPLPNGATFYIVSDAAEYPIAAPIAELNKLSPYCH